MKDRRNERGEGRIGAILSLAVVIAMGYAAWNALPAYFNNYAFKDKIVEIARLPKSNSEEKIREKLAHQAREYDLGDYLKAADFKIETRDLSRKIKCEYYREIQFLPGFKKKVHFSHDIDQPVPY